ncbi:MAG: hypothetical protein AAF589_02155 [Planctomycetota bacterium]
MDWSETLPVTAWIALHVGALAVACLSRFSLGGRWDAALQLLTLLGFVCVALAAVMAHAHGGDLLRLWVLSGTTLGAMVVAAVFEQGSQPHDPLLMQFVTAED